MRIWITRTSPGAEATARRLIPRGHDPLVAPLLSVHPLPVVPDLRRVEALAFTSAAGVKAFAEARPERGLHVYVVGEATGVAAESLGFQSVLAADGDVKALARLILADQDRLGGEVLHVGPADPAGDLVGELAAQGVAARFVAIYETLVEHELPAAVEKALRVHGLDAVAVHSPKAGRALAKLSEAVAELKSLQGFVLSEACAAPLRAAGFRHVAAAPFPREEALLKLIDAEC